MRCAFHFCMNRRWCCGRLYGLKRAGHCQRLLESREIYVTENLLYFLTSQCPLVGCERSEFFCNTHRINMKFILFRFQLPIYIFYHIWDFTTFCCHPLSPFLYSRSWHFLYFWLRGRLAGWWRWLFRVTRTWLELAGSLRFADSLGFSDWLGRLERLDTL